MAPAQAPTFTALLEMLPPGVPVPDPESVLVAAEVAISEGLVDPAGAEDAARALAEACRSAVPLREARAGGALHPAGGPALIEMTGAQAYMGMVTFSSASMRERASLALTSADHAGPFAKCFGGMPDEVRRRIECAEERPALREVLLRTAGEHLAAAALALASRLPGASASPEGDVTWACAGPTIDEVRAAMAWLSLPGPGALASLAVVSSPSGGAQ